MKTVSVLVIHLIEIKLIRLNKFFIKLMAKLLNSYKLHKKNRKI